MSEVLEHQAPAKVQPKSGVVPYLNLDGALKAAQLYVKAFGAEIAAQHPADDQGRTMHVHLFINGSSVMLSDFYPEHGHAFEKPQAFALTLIVDDIQAWFKRAVEAGCTAAMEPQKMFWGDWYGEVVDPFGVRWSMNQGD